MVPGASGPGQKKAAPPTPTAKLARYEETRQYAPVRTAPGRPVARRPKRPSFVRRFLTVLVSLLLILAVPVVSAYVAYKLASGENPFQWPPTVDLSRVF